MLSNYILPDILQYVFNLYIDWENDSLTLIKIFNFDFDIKPHLKIEKEFKNEILHIKSTYIDGVIFEKEEWYTDEKYGEFVGEKRYKNFYKNRILEEETLYYYSCENRVGYFCRVPLDHGVRKLKKCYYNKNKKIKCILLLLDGQQHEEQIHFYENGNIWCKKYYLSGVQEGTQYFYNKAGKLCKTEICEHGKLILTKHY
jgi:antitoxin component YwqK of YwqJK toxin-antitoxin module